MKRNVYYEALYNDVSNSRDVVWFEPEESYGEEDCE